MEPTRIKDCKNLEGGDYEDSAEETKVEVAEPDEGHSSHVSNFAKVPTIVDPCSQLERKEEISQKVMHTSLRQPDDDVLVAPKTHVTPTVNALRSSSFLDRKLAIANRRSKKTPPDDASNALSISGSTCVKEKVTSANRSAPVKVRATLNQGAQRASGSAGVINETLGLDIAETALVAPPLDEHPLIATLVDDPALVTDSAPPTADASAPLTSATASVLDLEAERKAMRQHAYLASFVAATIVGSVVVAVVLLVNRRGSNSASPSPTLVPLQPSANLMSTPSPKCLLCNPR